ncbi:hypothetical protein P872_02680 [Rhodonellum psychrophilum GCM71 = DSM 17998]|uniref:Uncharacterized protein n=1 Tax=Rhodonellum psychrophilum GCM71 = DSM 17998 TaxID=1123057 RepID=U5C1N8_9BACT|nr:hypothetical protein P872_02680 [Rhodonellum psychrophilum GCM71 = DSM 17998]
MLRVKADPHLLIPTPFTLSASIWFDGKKSPTAKNQDREASLKTSPLFNCNF